MPIKGASGFVMPLSLQLNRDREHQQVGRVCSANGDLPGVAMLNAILGTILQCFVVPDTVSLRSSFMSFVLASRLP